MGVEGPQQLLHLRVLQPRTPLPGHWSPASTQGSRLPQSAWALVFFPPPQPAMCQMVQLKVCL